MPSERPSEELQELIAGYVLGELAPEEAAKFEQCLAQDAAIAEAVTQMQHALELVYAPPEASPPPHLRAAILAHAQAANLNQQIPSIGRSTRRLPLRSLAEVAAAGLIMVLGIHNYRLQNELQTSQAEAQQYKALTYVLTATQTNSQASATVVVNPNNLKATVTFENLPPLPPGKVYALWTVVKPNAPFTTDPKRAILTEVFQVQNRDTFSQTIAVPKAYQSQDLVTKVAITIEDADAPQKHVGSPVLITDL